MHRTVLSHDLSAINDLVVRLGDLVATQIEMAVDALTQMSDWQANRVVAAERDTNQLRKTVEANCLSTIATQQPQARDLRALLSAVHIANELERIGGHAVGIANTTARLQAQAMPSGLPMIDLQQMKRIGLAMLKQAMLAFDRGDAPMAQHVATRDDEVDALRTQYIRVLLTYAMQDQRQIEPITYLLWVARDLERIADRVTNICERVVFAATGDVPVFNG